VGVPLRMQTAAAAMAVAVAVAATPFEELNFRLKHHPELHLRLWQLLHAGGRALMDAARRRWWSC